MSAATRAGYEPDKLLTGLADIITGRTDAVETRQILWRRQNISKRKAARWSWRRWASATRNDGTTKSNRNDGP